MTPSVAKCHLRGGAELPPRLRRGGLRGPLASTPPRARGLRRFHQGSQREENQHLTNVTNRPVQAGDRRRLRSALALVEWHTNVRRIVLPSCRALWRKGRHRLSRREGMPRGVGATGPKFPYGTGFRSMTPRRHLPAVEGWTRSLAPTCPLFRRRVEARLGHSVGLFPSQPGLRLRQPGAGRRRIWKHLQSGQ